MEALEFGIIERDLEDKIEKLKNEFSFFEKNNKDYSKLTISKYNHLVSMARVYQSEMDMFLKNDLYHIIGMGCLTPYQSYRFCQLVESYLSFRSDIKFFATRQSVQSKNREAESTYKLSTGIILKK